MLDTKCIELEFISGKRFNLGRCRLHQFIMFSVWAVDTYDISCMSRISGWTERTWWSRGAGNSVKTVLSLVSC